MDGEQEPREALLIVGVRKQDRIKASEGGVKRLARRSGRLRWHREMAPSIDRKNGGGGRAKRAKVSCSPLDSLRLI